MSEASTALFRVLHLIYSQEKRSTSLGCLKTKSNSPPTELVSVSPVSFMMSLTCCADAVCPADDVRVFFVELSSARHGYFTVIKLLDVPRVHRNGLQLHTTPVLQCDDSIPPLNVDPSQHAADPAVTFKGLTRNQSLCVTGTQEVRRRHGLGGLNWDRLWRG